MKKASFAVLMFLFGISTFAGTRIRDWQGMDGSNTIDAFLSRQDSRDLYEALLLPESTGEKFSQKQFASADGKVKFDCETNKITRPKDFNCSVSIDYSDSNAATEINIYEDQIIARLSLADSERLYGMLDLDEELVAMALDGKRLWASDDKAKIWCEPEWTACSITIQRK